MNVSKHRQYRPVMVEAREGLTATARQPTSGAGTEQSDMREGPSTRILIRRASGAVEIIGRKGHLHPMKAAAELATRGAVLVVRHEIVSPGATKVETVAIHEVAR